MRPGETFFTRWRLSWIAVFLLAALVYWPSLSGGKIWDDNQLMDPRTYGSGNLWQCFTAPFMGRYFRPLTSLTYWLDFHVAGTAPFQWHQTNLFLHAFGALAVMWCCWVVTERRMAAAFAGALFALQPSQVGAVAWIGGRTDCQAALLAAIFLGAIVQYFKNSRISYLALAGVAYFLCALTKEQTALLIFAVPFAERVFGKPSHVRMVVTGTVFGTLALAYLALVGTYLPMISRMAGVPTGFFPSRALVTLVHYTGLDLVPTPFGLTDLTLGNYESPVWKAVGAVLWLGWLAGLIMLWKKHRTLSWACACALLAYLPISNFMALPSLVVGPYRTAVAGVPLAVLFGGLFQLALNTSKIPTLTVGTAYLGLSAVATFWGIGTWQSETVWFANLGTYDRRSYIAELNKTTSDLINKRNDLAMAESDAYLNWIFGSSSWRISVMAGKAPQYTSEMLDRLETNVGTRDDVGPVLGRLLTLRGRIFLLMNSHQEAIPTLQAALSCYPKYAEPAAALGDIYAATDPARANRYYEQAVNLEPSIGNIYRLAKMRLDQHRFYEAESLFQAALRQNENIGDLWAGLASAQCSLGEQTECQESFKSATDRQILDKTTVSLVSKQIERFRYR